MIWLKALKLFLSPVQRVPERCAVPMGTSGVGRASGGGWGGFNELSLLLEILRPAGP